MEVEHQAEQEREEQRLSLRNLSLEERGPVTALTQQLVEAKTTIAVLTQQLKTGQLAQEKLERELTEARSSSSQLKMDLAVAEERLKAADGSQKCLEKQLTDAQARVAKEIPQLETELAVAKEQLKVFGDKFTAAKQEHTLQLENIELQLQSMEEKFEFQFKTAEDLLAKANREAADLPVPEEELYLASIMLTTDLSIELLCVMFVTGSSREDIDEKVQRLRGRMVPGTEAIFVESIEEADRIKQLIVDRGQALVQRRSRANPKLQVDVCFSYDPNKLCTRHADDEATTREEFFTLFRDPLTPLDDIIEHVIPPAVVAVSLPVAKVAANEIARPVKKLVDKATPPVSPTSENEETPVPRNQSTRSWRLPRIPQFGYRMSGSAH
ncbi:hypothetical protein V7S43_008713 [Phytophthora oleae]|uniref:Uncharacterized protein n=1 Tax=Phytophthora oleae TaxID=2107226 RepID=A0ABD3FHR7_9STRA